MLPQSHGDFRIGAENYQEGHVRGDGRSAARQLLSIGYTNLHENQRKLVDLCKKVDPLKTSQQIVDRFEKDHPPPDLLLPTFANLLSGLIDFINQKRIITIPSTVRPILEETPPFMRALTTASMDTPGPYERVATEAYFNVTLPEKNWSPARTEEFIDGIQPGHHCNHRDSRGISRALRPTALVPKGPIEDSKIAWLRVERRGLGPLTRNR